MKRQSREGIKLPDYLPREGSSKWPCLRLTCRRARARRQRHHDQLLVADADNMDDIDDIDDADGMDE